MLHVNVFRRGFAWLDAGTRQSLLQAAPFVHMIQERQGFKIACLEETAMNLSYLSPAEIVSTGGKMKSDYGRYLAPIGQERIRILEGGAMRQRSTIDHHPVSWLARSSVKLKQSPWRRAVRPLQHSCLMEIRSLKAANGRGDRAD